MPAKYFVAKPEAVIDHRDGTDECNLKTAEGKREYFRRTRQMSLRQNHSCAICKRFLVEPTFDHERTRKLGRVDSITYPDGRWRNAALCYECNGAKGSSRYAWQNGQYLHVFKGRV